jgi:hypothetical protein
MTGIAGTSPVRTLAALIGAHSCLLGLAMLLAPRTMLGLLGFGEAGPPFFLSQSGIFLLILGICYLMAVTDPSMLKVILVSKAFAVLFLFVHAAFLGAPRIIWAAGAGDLAMLLALVAALRYERSHLGARTRGGSK